MLEKKLTQCFDADDLPVGSAPLGDVGAVGRKLIDTPEEMLFVLIRIPPHRD